MSISRKKQPGGNMTLRQEVPDSLQHKLRLLGIKPEVLELVPEALARKHQIIPLEINNKTLHLAMVDPTNIVAIDSLATQTHLHVEPEAINVDEIQEALDFHYGPIEEDSDFDTEEKLEEIVRQVYKINLLGTASEEQPLLEEEIDSPIVRVLSLILNDAVKRGASDIHFQPQEHELLVRYRIDGSLHDVISLPVNTASSLISRIKIIANLNIADHRHPQDGQFALERSGRKGRKLKTDIRVSTVPSAHGESASLRLHDTSKILMDLTQLGFPSESLARYQEMLQVPYGMILVSGPTGSGKTTTLYASINSLDCLQSNIVTIEDPIEYDFYHITQIQTNVRADLTFANGLRSILRADPDVILVGEIRDAETAQIAIQSALTGHLVLSSIHANNAIGVISRLLDFGIEPFLIASALVGVIAQRMVKQICPNCAQEIEVSTLEQIAYAKETGVLKTEFKYGTGCELCNSGHKGRTGIFEMLCVSDEIRSMIINHCSSLELQQQALKEGMIPLIKAGMLKVKEEITTPGEVLRNAYSI